MKHLSLEQIFEYIDGNTQPAESRRIAVHLQECSVCRKEVKQHQSITVILEKSPVTEPSSIFSTELMSLVMNEPIPKAKRNPIIIKQIRASWLVA
ncbi:MAG: zf-HC2 domain-containing protein, partial [Ignavibacteriae bacterium]|nr:zf-HC2 domain-containing protein [Ignavibacteriota bacterium]